MTRKMQRYGIEWSYMPMRSYAAMYRGFQINIRRAGALTGGSWRLHVTRGGGSITFDHQFHKTIVTAMKFAIERVNQHPAALTEGR